MRDFGWTDNLWAVVKEDGTFAGSPCVSFEEARELAAQHEGAHIFGLYLDEDIDPYAEYDDCDDGLGFDPYEGCYTFDC